MHEMPKEIEFVSDKLLNNKPLYEEVRKMLLGAIGKLHNESLGHSTFCDALKTPNYLTKKLLTVYGINDRQCLDAFEKIGYHHSHRMYSNLYYQTLTIAYYTAIKSQDDLMRVVSLSLMYVKIFNGRLHVYMPNGCQSDIAQYLIQSIFRSTHTFKKYPAPFNAITRYYAPTMDARYNKQIEKDPGHPSKGLIILIMQGWARIDQTFYKSTQSHYYKAHADGTKIVIGSSDKPGGKEVDVPQSRIMSTVTTMQRNLVNGIKLDKEDIDFLKQGPQPISNKFLDDSIKFLDDSQNEDDLKNIYELMLSISKTDESSICGLNVVGTINKMSSAKGNNKEVSKLKTYIDQILGMMYKGIMKTGSNSSRLKLRKTLMLIILLRGKKAFCPKARFETTF